MVTGKTQIKKILFVLIGLLMAVVFSLPYILFSDQIREMAVVGYVGLFLACAVSNVSILIPSSATIIVLAAANTLNPWLSILCGGLGTALGEQSSYICGMIGTIGLDAAAHRNRQVLDALRKHAFLTVFVFALVPLPVFDIAGIAAGANRMYWGKYTLAAALGKILKFLFAFVGIFYMLPWTMEVLPGDWDHQILVKVLEKLGVSQ